MVHTKITKHGIGSSFKTWLKSLDQTRIYTALILLPKVFYNKFKETVLFTTSVSDRAMYPFTKQTCEGFCQILF